ncbi:MAG: hypothetical protein U0744_10065 [Gemmataceae bacterium]
MVELRRRAWPDPMGRDRRGTPEGLQAITVEGLRQHFGATFGPKDTIVSVAGAIEWERLLDLVGQLLRRLDQRRAAAPQQKPPIRGQRIWRKKRRRRKSPSPT